MSSATARGGHPGLSPSRRATTLCTPSAAMTIGASNRRPSRAVSVDARRVLPRLHDVDAGHELGAGLDGERRRAARRTRRAGSSAPPARPTRRPSTRRPGPSRCRRRRCASRCARSAGSRYGKRRRTRDADAAAARLVPRKRRAIEQPDRDTGQRERSRRGRAGRTGADDEDGSGEARQMPGEHCRIVRKWPGRAKYAEFHYKSGLMNATRLRRPRRAVG